jgi:hypothetical protein
MYLSGLNKILTLSVYVIAMVFVAGRDAHAYLDPGTGSYIFQILVAGLLGFAFAAKLFWKRIVDFFAKLFSK